MPTKRKHHGKHRRKHKKHRRDINLSGSDDDDEDAVLERRAARQRRRVCKLFTAVRTRTRAPVLYRIYRANVDLNSVEEGDYSRGNGGGGSVGGGTGASLGLGRTPLHIACALGALDVAQVLIEHGARVDVRDSRGATPLHYAVRCAHTAAAAEAAAAAAATANSGVGQAVEGLEVDGSAATSTDAADRLAVSAATLCALLVAKGADGLSVDDDGVCPEALGLGDALDAHVEHTSSRRRERPPRGSKEQQQQQEEEEEEGGGGMRARQQWDEKIRDEFELDSHSRGEHSFGFGGGWHVDETTESGHRKRGGTAGDWFEQVSREYHDKRRKTGDSPTMADRQQEAKERARRSSRAPPAFAPVSGGTTHEAPTEADAAAAAATAAASAQAVKQRREREKQTRREGREADERAWLAFAARASEAGAAVDMQGVPWPSGPPHNLLHLELGAEHAEMKAAIRAAWLRWHPDKFMQKFGALVAGDSEAVLERLNVVAKHINGVKASVEQEE